MRKLAVAVVALAFVCVAVWWIRGGVTRATAEPEARLACRVQDAAATAELASIVESLTGEDVEAAQARVPVAVEPPIAHQTGTRVEGQLAGSDGRPWALADLDFSMSLWILHAGGEELDFWSGLHETAGSRFAFHGVDLTNVVAMRLDAESQDFPAHEFAIDRWAVRGGAVDVGMLTLPSTVGRVELVAVTARSVPIPGASAVRHDEARVAARDARSWHAAFDGRIVVPHRPSDDSVRLHVAAPGFASQFVELENGDPPRRVVLTAGADLALSLEIPAGAERLGLVVRGTPQGDAVAPGTPVLEVSLDEPDGRVRLERLAAATEYRIELCGGNWLGLPLELGTFMTPGTGSVELAPIDLTSSIQITAVIVKEPVQTSRASSQPVLTRFRHAQEGASVQLVSPFRLAADGSQPILGFDRVKIAHRPHAQARVEAEGFRPSVVHLAPPVVELTLHRAAEVPLRLVGWDDGLHDELAILLEAFPPDWDGVSEPWTRRTYVFQTTPQFELSAPVAGRWRLRFEIARGEDDDVEPGAARPAGDWPVVFEAAVLVPPDFATAIDVVVPADVLARLR